MTFATGLPLSRRERVQQDELVRDAEIRRNARKAVCPDYERYLAPPTRRQLTIARRIVGDPIEE